MASLRVGAARANITPSIGCHMSGSLGDRLAEDVLDELYARAVVIETATGSAAWAVCDLIALQRPEIDQAKKLASRATGIPTRHMMIACTHTHYGPMVLPQMFDVPRNDDYVPWAVRKIADAIILAHRRRQPARMGLGSAQCPEEVHNRRHHMKDGTVKMNPGVLNPDIVKPAGPTDPEIVFAVFQTPDSQPIAVVANYALHYVGGPYGTSISADYFGAFDRQLQRMVGSAFVAMMVNGCFGDINNIDVTRHAPTYDDPFGRPNAVAERVADRVRQAWQGISAWDDAPRLNVATEEFEFRRREIPDDELAEAREIVAGRQKADLLDRKYAVEMLALHQEPVCEWTVMQAFALGGLGMANMPGEGFVELGLGIKKRSPTARTMVAGLGNDWLGYIPTDRAFDQGGYELRTARSAKAARGMGEALVDAAARLLQEAQGQGGVQ